MSARTTCATTLLPLLLAVACAGPLDQPRSFDAAGALETVAVLADDAMQGRRIGTEGGARARAWLVQRLTDLGLQPAGSDGYEAAFSYTPRRRGEDQAPVRGVNLLARLDGRTPGVGPLLVVSAHYDHLGERGGEIYNGADDNASGVAGALAIAEAFLAESPRHDVLIALLDGEESGLRGARALVADPPVPVERLALNLNLDMLSKSDVGELYASGAYHFAALGPLLDGVAARAPVTLLQGHDDPALGHDDWTGQSDHGVFLQAGIPFVYLGVEDHPEYHQPTDVFATIPQAFFLDALETAVLVARTLDAQLEVLDAGWKTQRAAAAAVGGGPEPSAAGSGSGEAGS